MLTVATDVKLVAAASVVVTVDRQTRPKAILKHAFEASLKDASCCKQLRLVGSLPNLPNYWKHVFPTVHRIFSMP